MLGELSPPRRKLGLDRGNSQKWDVVNALKLILPLGVAAVIAGLVIGFSSESCRGHLAGSYFRTAR